MKPKEIAELVYAVGGPGLSHPTDCCVYLVDAGKELVLIDAGAGPGAEAILRNVEALGFDPTGIGHLVATHCHIDHIGGISRIKEATDCMLMGHQLDRDGIELGDLRLTAADLYGIEYWPTKIDMILEGAEEKRVLGNLEFHFVATPGHTPGSIAVYLDLEEGRVLFGQDVHGPFSEDWGSDIDEWRRSMEKLLRLDADLLCEGHAGIFRGEDVRDYIESQLRRYRQL
ncbi:MAG: MBL fold metallo-hydrolase [Methanothrix sp.]|jgi:glyoxylase-like metal-dependent hydrolase (beta-lactamase superfamily II)|nr:MBL fold metallo-hydrolase [Methanothrix harundinacea]MDD5767312.1 MBL fold metallo-hydrolase [Methanothrix sp.]